MNMEVLLARMFQIGMNLGFARSCYMGLDAARIYTIDCQDIAGGTLFGGAVAVFMTIIIVGMNREFNNFAR